MAILVGSLFSGTIGYLVIKGSKSTKARENERLIRTFYNQVYNNKDLSLIPELFTEDCVFRGSIGQEKVGHEGIADYVNLIIEALDKFECTFIQIISEDDDAYARIRFLGIHQGHFMGYSPSGKPVSWIGSVEFKFRNGMISELWALGDLHGLVQQLKANSAAPGL